MKQVEVNSSYEIYQIITDFADPLELFREAYQNAFDEEANEVFCQVYYDDKMAAPDLIIDIWNNGHGLPRNLCNCFFDLANSSKVNNKLVSNPAKIGYKGHGSKIFFNAEKILICSKTKDDHWAAKLENPLRQIDYKGKIEYEDGLKPDDVSIEIPSSWEEGFFVRIINHKHFISRLTHSKLNHKVIRDYSGWFTVFGTINTLFDFSLKGKGIKLYLHGLGFKDFKVEYSNSNLIDPLPLFKNVDNVEYEEISLGHHFPDNRTTDRDMKAYVKKNR